LLIINAGGKEVAVVVDHIVQGREVVIKNLGSHLRQVRGIMGATLMGDGSVVLILNPADLLDEPAQTGIRSWETSALPKRDTWNIMVVDDSVSVRRIVSNLIKNAGWQPTTAKDGLEALEIIQHAAQPPDLILLDVEMPRMDGFELTATLRGQEAYKDVPIVMLTSRAGEKHRRRAFEMGISQYLVKPYQDEMLLGTVRQLVRASRGATSA
jgi:chemosensory pili system protein ChpA (sensor histidine kinase/response regulator)